MGIKRRDDNNNRSLFLTKLPSHLGGLLVFLDQNISANQDGDLHRLRGAENAVQNSKNGVEMAHQLNSESLHLSRAAVPGFCTPVNPSQGL